MKFAPLMPKIIAWACEFAVAQELAILGEVENLWMAMLLLL
jgi:hypothetical protein